MSDAISAQRVFLASSRARFAARPTTHPPPTSAVPLAPSPPPTPFFGVSASPPPWQPLPVFGYSFNQPRRSCVRPSVRPCVHSIRSGRSSSSVRSCTLLLPIPSKTLTRQKTKEPHSVCASLTLAICIRDLTTQPTPPRRRVGCALGQKIRFRLVRPSSKDPRIKGY